MTLLDKILEECPIQTDAERHAYLKVRDELLASGVEDIDELQHQARTAKVRLNCSPNLKFPKVYHASCTCPMRFETAEEMKAYIDIRERLVVKHHEDRRMAMAMALHTRLGGESAIRMLSTDIVSKIVHM